MKEETTNLRLLIYVGSVTRVLHYLRCAGLPANVILLLFTAITQLFMLDFSKEKKSR
ncbi:hypothetical protein ACF0H5_010766 [Mactra antiquata]